VVTWGSFLLWRRQQRRGGALDGTIDVTQVFSTSKCLCRAARRWLGGDLGDSSSAMAATAAPWRTKLDGTIDVTQVFSTDRAFAALRADGSVVTWGFSVPYGGNSSAVARRSMARST
jgi:hypothetical protein